MILLQSKHALCHTSLINCNRSDAYLVLAQCARLPYILHPTQHPPPPHTHTSIYLCIPVLLPNIGEVLLKAEKKKRRKKINLIMNNAFRCRANKLYVTHFSSIVIEAMHISCNISHLESCHRTELYFNLSQVSVLQPINHYLPLTKSSCQKLLKQIHSIMKVNRSRLKKYP